MYRVGFGYDSHRFVEGRPLMLGGVEVAYELGLAGHSDADAVLHAVTDAILGAAGAADIGELFPDSDPKWRDIASAIFVREAVKLADEKGFRVINCDVTVIAELPMLTPYKEAMRNNIAEMLGVEGAAVSVKAKTNEGMGFVGAGEGLAAVAVVAVRSAADSGAG